LTEKPERVVLDTNIILSGVIFRGSTPFRAAVRAFERAKVLSSAATRNELREVARREKFERYVPLERRIHEVEELIEDMESVEIRERLQVCVDPKDDMLLDLAVNGNADFIVTGDDHLLRLNPFRGITILTPLSYLELQGSVD
jgi:putative PIN family toxin of toxin-antitoxin system